MYAVIVLMIYTWTIMWFFWKLPSWLFFLNTGEILTIFMYSLAVNFVESLIVCCVPILLSAILPQAWFHDAFVPRGTALAIAGLGYMMYLAVQFQTKNDYPSLNLKAWSLALAVAAISLIVFLAGRINVSRKVLQAVAEQATIFLFITIPVSMVSVLVVLFRSIG